MHVASPCGATGPAFLESRLVSISPSEGPRGAVASGLSVSLLLQCLQVLPERADQRHNLIRTVGQLCRLNKRLSIGSGEIQMLSPVGNAVQGWRA